MIGSQLGMGIEEDLCILVMGQSNADGRCTANRLANTSFNYKGIATGYPAARTTQDQYPYVSGDPTPGLKVYFKTAFASADQSLDNGAWYDYEIGLNNGHFGSGTAQIIGPEFSMGVKLNDLTGKDIYIIKCAYAGTALTSTITPTNPPGIWNNTNRFIAMEYFVDRAVRDYKAANPGRRLRLLGVVWWQGENDANAGISTATYTSQFNSFKAYVEGELYGHFVLPKGKEPIWNLVKLNFYQDAAEGLINTALSNIVAANPGFYLVDSTPYPQCQDLTVGEASPIAVGTPNSVGGSDDAHSSYIAQLAVGELCAQNVIDAGLLA